MRKCSTYYLIHAGRFNPCVQLLTLVVVAGVLTGHLSQSWCSSSSTFLIDLSFKVTFVFWLLIYVKMFNIFIDSYAGQLNLCRQLTIVVYWQNISGALPAALFSSTSLLRWLVCFDHSVEMFQHFFYSYAGQLNLCVPTVRASGVYWKAISGAFPAALFSSISLGELCFDLWCMWRYSTHMVLFMQADSIPVCSCWL